MTDFLVFKVHKEITVAHIDKPILTIGRSNSDYIRINDKGVSRSHATIYYSNKSFWMIDGTVKGKSSTNGLFVNSKKITIHKLNSCDIITFCQGVYAFYIENKNGKMNSVLFSQAIVKLVDFWGRTNTGELDNHNGEEYVDAISHTYLEKIQNPYLDGLTGLPDRATFFERVKKSIEFRKKITEDYKFSVFFIDVDRFKIINDSLGHLVGDHFLVAIAEKLSTCIREKDLVARLGGDEFAILLDDLNAFDEAVSIARRIQDSLIKPLEIDGHELYPSLSIGIALSSLDYQNVEEIVRDADTAMYHAKKTGKSRFVVFDADMHQQASELLRLDGDLRKAIENQELKLVYQPIVSIAERRVVGFEALIRWDHPELGAISPAKFIPIAEETNLIYKIGNWVLNEACSQLQEWTLNPAITSDLSINVNLSAKQLTDPSIVKTIRRILVQYDIHPKKLKLEVTESILMENESYSVKVLTQLRKMGIQLAVDDFGTGYSSLSYLHRLPIDTLKVDQSFISSIDEPQNNTSINITNSIINLAHSIGVKVVAEGVERLYHLVWLEQQKCDYAQGFLFSQPLNGDKATNLAERGLDWKWKT
jgi:diguanylate cyclase (GGDEF)-like protein